MFCRYCGASLPNGSLFCSACGKKVEQAQPISQTEPQSASAQNAGNQIPYSAGYPSLDNNVNQTPYAVEGQPPYDGAVQTPYSGEVSNPYTEAGQPTYGTGYPTPHGMADQAPYSNTYPPINPVSNPPMAMKWYKFLIYFSLFAGAVLNLSTAVSLLTGSAYGDAADFIYDTFPALLGLDLLYGTYALFLAIFSILTRQKLAHFKASGPKMITALYIMSCVGSFLYSIMVTAIIGDASAISSSLVSQIAVSICMTVYNYRYFNQRAHMFH